MSENRIMPLINSLPESDIKEKLLNEFALLDRKFKKLETRYIKVNEDKLTLSHLLTEVNADLKKSLANEKRFVASISHELRTPLTSILGYTELLEDTTLDNKQKRYLNNVRQSSDHLLALISDLLDVAKLEDNRIELSPKEFDLDDVLNDCATLIKSKVAHDVEFVTDIPMLDYSVIGDDKRLKQVMINILSNAAKFTKKGSIRFYVKELEELEENTVKIVVNVDDTGDGIPDEVTNTLFDPFQSTDKTQGTGLGLFISQQLVQLMGGNITVKSTAGTGSSFSIAFIVEKSNKREFGEELKGSNIMMFSERNDFTDKLSKEFMNYRINFQNFYPQNSDISTALIQMIAGGKFYDIAVFDLDVFKESTHHIAGTLRAINPGIKLVALVGDGYDGNMTEFDSTIAKPIPYQRFIKELGSVYAEEMFVHEEEVDYSHLKLLIVEDVAINREYEKEMLNNFFSISCDTAVDGKEAVEKAKNTQYDLILMDMRMPVMDGLEATRAIRKFDRSIPIICMSANVYKEDKLAAKSSGMNDFIEKPLSKSDIENKLLKVIKNDFSKTEQEPSLETDSDRNAPEALETLALKHLEAHFPNDVAQKLYAKARESIKEYLERMNTNFKNKDTASLVEDFHALKGVCANIGLDQIASKAGQLQKIAEAGDFLALSQAQDEIMTPLNDLLKYKK